mgnify:FL=1
MNQPQAGLYKAYTRANHTVSKTRQVVMLYDGAIRFLQQAAGAIEAKDYELRYHKLTRAADIIVGLQSCLDFDVGGPPAKGLYDFYATIEMKIFTLQRSNDLAECNALITEIKEMRDVWDGIDRGDEKVVMTDAEKPAAPPLDPTTVSA